MAEHDSLTISGDTAQFLRELMRTVSISAAQSDFDTASARIRKIRQELEMENTDGSE